MPTVQVLALDGEIDLHLSPEVAATLCSLMATKPQRVVVDLGKVTYLDSSGLAVLIDGMQNTQQYGGKFFLAAIQESVKPIFELACLDQIFKVFPDVECALAAN